MDNPNTLVDLCVISANHNQTQASLNANLVEPILLSLTDGVSL